MSSPRMRAPTRRNPTADRSSRFSFVSPAPPASSPLTRPGPFCVGPCASRSVLGTAAGTGEVGRKHPRWGLRPVPQFTPLRGHVSARSHRMKYASTCTNLGKFGRKLAFTGGNRQPQTRITFWLQRLTDELRGDGSPSDAPGRRRLMTDKNREDRTCPRDSFVGLAGFEPTTP